MSKIQFTNRQGIQLTGNFEQPEEGPLRATALFAHCFTCGRDVRAARAITRALAAEGLGVLRFDFTGLGESEGDFAGTSFSSNLDDLEDAAQWLAENTDPPCLLIGHSLGGAAVLAVAERLDSVRAIATIGAPSSPENVLKQFGDTGLEAIKREGSSEVDLAGRSFKVRQDFVDDARNHDLEERIAQLGRALLVMHSPLDRVVAISHAERIFSAARHPRSFVSLEQADHLLSRQADGVYAARVIAAWASRYLRPA